MSVTAAQPPVPLTLAWSAPPGQPLDREAGGDGEAVLREILRAGAVSLRVVAWDADPDGHPTVHPCSRYVELYWLTALGPSGTWLLRRLSYGLDVQPGGFELPLAETAAALGLSPRLGFNAPMLRTLRRLVQFRLARPGAPRTLAVRTQIPPIPPGCVQRLPAGLRASHERWSREQQLPRPEQLRRQAERLAASLAAQGCTLEEIESRLWAWKFHPSLAHETALRALGGAGSDGQGGGEGDEHAHAPAGAALRDDPA